MEVASPVELLALVVAATASTAMQLQTEIPSARGQYAGKVDLLIRAVIGHSKRDLYAIVQISGGDCTCEGPATKSGLRNPPMQNVFIGLSCGADHCGFN